MSRAIPTFVLFIIYIVLIILRSAKKTGASGKTSTPAQAAPRADRPTPTIPVLARRRGHKDDDCEYGEVNHQYSHDGNRRVQQLKGYLEAGLIDKKEYAQMLERYTKQDQAYENYNR